MEQKSKNNNRLEKDKSFSNYFFKLSNTAQILWAGGISVFIIVIIFGTIYCLSDINTSSNANEINESLIITLLKTNGIWTLITAIISSPILFIIWRFRDQNATQQINNQRKDINLKEFQKIAEWVSGSHLIENEITEKTNSNPTIPEKTTKYTSPAENQSIPTFSKKDGAVGLQIAAIHNLLPFFQGKHGDDFRRPALNLLTSAWLSLQQPLLLELDQIDILEDENAFNAQINKIRNQGTSPIGIAITQVLLSDGGDNLLQFPEVFPNLCLAGMNFHLVGLDEKILTLFQRAENCQGINLISTNLNEAKLQGTQLQWAKLQGAKLQKAKLKRANLQKAELQRANLQQANLQQANLQQTNLLKADLLKANLQQANLQKANLLKANLQQANLLKANLLKANLLKAKLPKANLREASLQEANLLGAYLRRTNLEQTNLEQTDLQQTDLQQTNLLGAITYFSNNNEIITNLKPQGCVILHAQENSFSYSKLYLIKNNLEFEHIIYKEIDLEKTRQTNPDWEITIEEIE